MQGQAKVNENAIYVKSEGKRRSRLTISTIMKRAPLLIGCIALFIIGSFASPSFLTLYNVQNLLRHTSILGTLAIGVTVVMLTREIDLCGGSLMAFAIILAVLLTARVESLRGIQAIVGTHYLAHGTRPMIFFTLIIGAMIGLINGVITTKGKVKSLITTLGMLYALRGASFVISGGHAVYLTRIKKFQWLAINNVLKLFPVCFVVFMGIGIVVAILLGYTIVGRRIYAIGGNEKAAKFTGINTDAWKIFAFVISGLCAAIAALMYSSYLASADPQQAVGYELSAIAIVVLGGTTLEGGRGSIVGTLLAALVVGILTNILELIGLRIWYQQVIIGLIIISAVALAYRRRIGV